MNPNDIPASVMAMGSAPMRVAYPKQMPTAETMREIIAHYWPAIEQHIRQQIASEIEQCIRTWEGMSDQATERARGMAAAAAIARGHAYRPQATDVEPTGTARQQNNHDAYTL